MKHAVGMAGLLLLVLGSSANAASPAPAPPTLPPAVAAQYVHPHDRVDIGKGRKLNLFCMGKGSHTVIFDAGLSDWSVIWALVQPGVAAHARACTYDRAGMGYSDPSGEPRSAIAIVEDLQKLIHAAKIATPVILVGHSLGGFNLKLYAALHPQDVAGLVLVDPTEERMFARIRGTVRAKFGATVAAELELHHAPGSSATSQAVSDYNACAAAARAHDLDAKSEFYKSCTDPAWAQFGPIIAAERERIQVKRAYQEAQASEVANSVIANPGSDDAFAALFSGHALGDKPLIVLTHGIFDPKDQDDTAGLFAINAMHGQTAALSTRGVNRIVPGTHHNIQIDRPQAVIDAIGEVLREVEIK